MKNCDKSFEINQNPNWTYIPHHPYWIIIMGSSGSDKNNVLLNLENNNKQILTKFV